MAVLNVNTVQLLQAEVKKNWVATLLVLIDHGFSSWSS